MTLLPSKRVTHCRVFLAHSLTASLAVVFPLGTVPAAGHTEVGQAADTLSILVGIVEVGPDIAVHLLDIPVGMAVVAAGRVVDRVGRLVVAAGLP